MEEILYGLYMRSLAACKHKARCRDSAPSRFSVLGLGYWFTAGLTFSPVMGGRKAKPQRTTGASLGRAGLSWARGCLNPNSPTNTVLNHRQSMSGLLKVLGYHFTYLGGFG